MRLRSDGLAVKPWHSLWILLGVMIGPLSSVAGYGQVQLLEIPLPSQILEPGANTPMTMSPTSLGDGAVVFAFEVKDVDPLADDLGDVTITGFIIDNLGSATHDEIAQVMVLDEGNNAVAGPAAPVAGPNPNISFRASFSPLTILIPDDQAKIFRIAVRTKGTNDLQSKAQNHTLQLQVTLGFTEDIGSPPAPTNFLNAITDGTPDLVFNGGINRLRALDFTPEPIRTNSQGTVASFEICDQDANGHELRLTALILVQGPLGSARSADISDFALFLAGGSSPLTSSGPPSPNFDRGGAGFSWSMSVPVQDDTCQKFEIKATASPTAMRGRTIHLRITFLVEEPLGTAIHPSVAPAIQMPQTVMIGSGVLRIPDMQISGIRSRVPLEVVGFPNVGLGRLEVQTVSVLFDPQVIRIEELVPEPPYQTSSVRIDNRAGRLNFTLFVDPAQSPSAKAGSRQPEAVAQLIISKTARSQPGQRSILALQVDLIEDAGGTDITTQVVVVSGSVILLTPGDVDLLDGIPTIRDALMLANAILPCLKVPPEPISGLSDEQKRVADVAEPKAPTDEIPDCSTLNAADVTRIAELALTFEAAGLVGEPRRPSGSAAALLVRDLRLSPLGQGLWQLSVTGSGIASVQVEGFDLGGKKRFAASAVGTRLQWRALEGEGRPLANGVYLYVVTVKGLSGEEWRSPVRKLVVLR